jgi:hypothetical protein
MSESIKDWHKHPKGDPVPWLLEEDNPPVRYFTLQDLLHRGGDDPEVADARSGIMASRPVREILEAQYPQGYWVKPGRGYSPKYRATVWQVMFLADLGATATEAVHRACQYVLEQSLAPEEGLFSATKARTGTIICLNGNLLRALCFLGYGDHPTVRLVTRNLAVRIQEEGFSCRANSADRSRKETWLPCAWGAVKALGAFAAMPDPQPSGLVQQAIGRGVDLLLSRDPSTADYPSGTGTVSPLWFKLGFPLGYSSDLLELVDVLAQLGHGGDQRLRKAIEIVLSKKDSKGRWPLEHTLGKTWTRFGEKGEPSKWVTLRALRMLSRLP